MYLGNKSDNHTGLTTCQLQRHKLLVPQGFGAPLQTVANEGFTHFVLLKGELMFAKGLNKQLRIAINSFEWRTGYKCALDELIKVITSQLRDCALNIVAF